jgi:hypothetical protein
VRTLGGPEDRARGCGFHKRGGAQVEGREVLLEGWKSGRRVEYTNRGRRKGGRPGGETSIGEDTGKFEFPWEKKRGRGGKVDGLSAGAYGRYQGAWPEPRQKRKPKGWLEKRRRVTVTEDDGLDPKREAQDEASRIGTKPSGVMTR